MKFLLKSLLIAFTFLSLSQASAGAPSSGSAGYQVRLETSNANPISCTVLSKRLRYHLTRISEASTFAAKIESGKNLSFDEISALKALTREILPMIVDSADQEVTLDVRWKLFDDSPVWASSATERRDLMIASNSDFANFKAEGPGLRWTSLNKETPNYLLLEFTDQIHLRYKVTVFDFCFGSNEITLQGRKGDNLSSTDPVLSAKWNKDLMHKQQFGFVQVPAKGMTYLELDAKEARFLDELFLLYSVSSRSHEFCTSAEVILQWRSSPDNIVHWTAHFPAGLSEAVAPIYVNDWSQLFDLFKKANVTQHLGSKEMLAEARLTRYQCRNQSTPTWRLTSFAPPAHSTMMP